MSFQTHQRDTIENRGVDWLRCLLGLESGQTPFPWQERLLKQLMKDSMPDALDIPTGLGKTSVIAIWTAARATGARVPRRLVYVVDRRAVVDQATDEAERIRKIVDETPELKSALGLTRSLPISTLRGQHVDNQLWLENPSSPAIVVGTVDMIGSRLLFEGYRCSRKMRPYHAALLGADALVVLDEAHLVPAFEAMVRAVATNESFKPIVSKIVPPSIVLSLSATGRTTSATFQLDGDDRKHAIVKRRLDAKKRVRIVAPVAQEALAETLASQAWTLTNGGKEPSRVIVFVDSRKTAQAVCDDIGTLAKLDSIQIETVLFVGGRRVAEREDAATTLERLGLIAGSKQRSEKPVFVVATSAGEVGVDLDADHAVLDLVEWERIVQRLGRVNRRGDGAADIRIVPTLPDEKLSDLLAKDAKLRERSQPADEHGGDEPDADDDESDETEDKEPKRLKATERERVARHHRREAAARALRSLPTSNDSHLASPRALSAVKAEHAELVENASTPAPPHPMLTRAVVESWSMTSLEEHAGRPNVRPWLRGWVEEEPQTSVVWRRWLPKQRDAKAFFEAASVQTIETLELESKDVLDWLLKRVKRIEKAQVEGGSRDDSREEEDYEEASSTSAALMPGDLVMFVLDDKPRGWTLEALAALDKNQRDDLLRDLAGETIVVDTRLGGLDAHGLLDPKADEATDVGERERLPFRVRDVEDLTALEVQDGHWRVEDTFVSRTNDEGEAIAWFVVETDLRQQSTTADGRSTGREQALVEHQSFAERHAKTIGACVGLAQRHVDLLALAAVLHDEGKKADRWQRAFRAPKDRRPLGKTTSRPLQSILAGYRHELGSLPYAERDPRVAALAPEDRDLVLHLIAAHHGFARPILRTDGCDDAPPSALVERARSIALRFARLEKRWGPWGLAWWEMLLRAADQAASRENDERGGKRG